MAEEYNLIRPSAGEEEKTESPQAQSILSSITQKVKEASGLLIPSSVAPGEVYPDDETDYQARSMESITRLRLLHKAAHSKATSFPTQ